MSASSSTASVVRTVGWIVVSSLFLFSNWQRIAVARAHGVSPGLLSWSLLTIWIASLVFWLCVGWRSWTRGIG